MSHLLQWDLAPQGVQDRHARLFPRPLLQEWGGVQTRTLHMHRVSALKPTPDPLLGACRGVLSLLSMQARLSCMHTYTLTNQAVRLRLVGRIEGGRESVRSWAILARVPVVEWNGFLRSDKLSVVSSSLARKLQQRKHRAY